MVGGLRYPEGDALLVGLQGDGYSMLVAAYHDGSILAAQAQEAGIDVGGYILRRDGRYERTIGPGRAVVMSGAAEFLFHDGGYRGDIGLFFSVEIYEAAKGVGTHGAERRIGVCLRYGIRRPDGILPFDGIAATFVEFPTGYFCASLGSVGTSRVPSGIRRSPL